MKRLRLGAALLILSTSSYAWSAAPEGLLGGAMPTPASPTPAAAPAGTPKGLLNSGVGAKRLSTVVSGLQPDANVTRGGAEMKVYREASPSVVMILTEEGFGSGALISADGKIVTNLHVVGDEPEVWVVFKPKQEGAEVQKSDLLKGRVLRRDALTDLALVQVSEVPAGVKPLALGTVEAMQVGSDVHAIGHPTGEMWTYTRGVISQIRRDYAWKAGGGEYRATVLQTQTPINPGNSGGPLLDDQMEIVGINTFGAEGEGLNFAISADDVKAFLARTSDRLPVSAKASAKAAACEVTSLEEWPEKKPKGVNYLIDADCDGQGDYIVLVPKDASEPMVMMYDDDEDGKIDTIILDNDRDGNFDVGLYDTDGDGAPDMEGQFKNGETTPWRMERIED